MWDETKVDLEGVRIALAETGLHVIKDSELTALVDQARREYFQAQSACALAPQKQRFHYTDLRSAPHRKLTIGSTNGLGEPYAQFLQTTYFCKDHPEFPALGAVFSYLISLRNRILGMNEEFGNTPELDGFWNACRVHHYPSGGGFMTRHRDSHFPALLKDSGHPFLQVLVVLSTRGRDFRTGGGFVVTRGGEKVFYEDETSSGAIVCFDGSVVHGVDDVDNDQVVDFQAHTGRIAGFVGLYEVLS